MPDARLEIYSSMAVYNDFQDPFQPLYDVARTSPGVAYHGSVAQPALAQALRRATMLAYPNTFAETSCISVMEAMAAGCTFVTSYQNVATKPTSSKTTNRDHIRGRSGAVATWALLLGFVSF